MKFMVTIERPDYWTTTEALAPQDAVRVLSQARQLGLVARAVRAEESEC